MISTVLEHHLQQENIVISHDMKSNLYVDNNVISGGATEEEAMSYYKEAHSIMSSVNMNLHSWSSSSVKLNTIAAEDNVHYDSQSVNVLGLWCNPTADDLQNDHKLY